MLVCGVNLGGKNKKTTGICILEEREERLKRRYCRIVKGDKIIKTLRPWLKDIDVIAVDGPLTRGAGKGNFRLFEKFLSQKPFRKAKIQPLPPALMPQIVEQGISLANNLKSFGFSLDKNLIEVYLTFLRKVGKKLPKGGFKMNYHGHSLWYPQAAPSASSFSPASSTGRTRGISGSKIRHKEDAFLCASLALLHLKNETFWVGYRDGKLFFPGFKCWKQNWCQRFAKIWQKKHPFKYKFLQIGGKT